MQTSTIDQAATATRDRLSPRLGPAAIEQVDAFLDQAARIGDRDAYKFFPDAARQIVARQQSAGVDPRAFLRAALCQRVLKTLASPRLASLPPRVRHQQLAQLARIAADADAAAEWLDLDSDLFHKEFGIASLRLYVAGCQLVDPRCGFPRSLLLRGTPLDWLRNALMLLSLGGHRPYFEIHAHLFMLDLFGEEGRNECYRCCVELYELHPEIRGMIAGSWFYDPALETVSPRLAYLRKVPLAGGAWLLFVDESGAAAANALARSPTRRKLYDEGRYKPRNYMIVWGKTRQQAWARAERDSGRIGE